MVLTAMFKVLWVHCLPAFRALRGLLSGLGVPWARCHPLPQVARCSPLVRCRIQCGGTSAWAASAGASAETWAALAALGDASEDDSSPVEVLEGKRRCVKDKKVQNRGKNGYLKSSFFGDQKKMKYMVFLKKVLHKREEKMKMTWQRDENLVQVQQQCSVYFCIKTFFKS